MPNSSTQRLLDLFPVGALKSKFGFKGPKAAVLHSLAINLTVEEVRSFALEHHASTRQHVHVLGYPEMSVAELPADPLHAAGLVGESIDGDARTFFYLLDLDYRLILDDPLAKIRVPMLWPVRVTCTPRHTVVALTVMAKSPAAFKEDAGERPIIKIAKPFEDGDIIRKLRAVLPDDTREEDLNKGVKALWDSGRIDARSVRWRKAKASARQTMDEKFTIRHDDVALYGELRHNPLYATLFEWLGEETDEVGESQGGFAFSVNPTQGLFIFRRYPRKEVDANVVIREVLRNN